MFSRVCNELLTVAVCPARVVPEVEPQLALVGHELGVQWLRHHDVRAQLGGGGRRRPQRLSRECR